MITLSEIIRHLENIAPLGFQESYDNSGLITGSPAMEITGALICLDSTEAIIDEAIKHKLNLVIAHHPIVFSGLKKFTGKNYVERTIIKAIQNNVAIYAIHTNLDNVKQGVNKTICDKLGLINTRILAPKKGLLKKLVTYVPESHSEELKNSLFAAGAGNIGNYSECSFTQTGTGTFKGNDFTNPHTGKKNERYTGKEQKVEVIFENHREQDLLNALVLNHPYEEVAYEIYSTDNQYNDVGSGMVGDLKKPMNHKDFLDFLKNAMKTGCIRYTNPLGTDISKIAVCGGSGSFLLNAAIQSGADAFITSDFKYHQFFDADGKIMIMDIGHYESEQFTKDLIYSLLKEKFSKFALRLSDLNTNPINYF